MTTTYKWTISMLECMPNYNGLENVVQTIRWRFSGDDGVNFAEIYNATPMAVPDPAEFVQYNSLTEEQVVTWLTDALGEHGVESAKAAIDARLADLANPPVIIPELPWTQQPSE